MLLEYYGVPEENRNFNLAEKSLLEWMDEKLGKNAAVLNNADVGLLCSFISDGNPVIASYEDGYVLIYSYTKAYVNIINPVSGERKKMKKDEAKKAFEAAGGKYFVSY